MKYRNYLFLSLVTLFIGLQSCKTKSSIPKGEMVEIVMYEGVTPALISSKSPFALVEAKQMSKSPNKWQCWYDISKYTKSDLTNYLIHRDGVVSIDGIEKVETPPIRGPRAPQAIKKQ